MYMKAKAKVKTSNRDSNVFNLGNGVLQGESLSPKLFALFLEDLVRKLHYSNMAYYFLRRFRNTKIGRIK